MPFTYFHPKYILATKIDNEHYVLATNTVLKGTMISDGVESTVVFDPTIFYFRKMGNNRQPVWHVTPNTDYDSDICDVCAFNAFDMEAYSYSDPNGSITDNGIFGLFFEHFIQTVQERYRQYKISTVL